MTGGTEEVRVRRRRFALRGWRDTEFGQSLVEFSLILPVFVVLLFAIVDFGRAFYTWLVVTNAAREGARVGATQQPLTAIQSRITSSIGSLDPAKLTVTTANVQGPRGQPITVSLTYNFAFATPIGSVVALLGNTLSTPTIGSTSTMRLE
jgi:Flp pilus assembly protein TadG